jgi:predicted CoA-binding protein
MKSNYELFFEKGSFAVVGNSKSKKFPILTYRGLKKQNKKVVAVDLALDQVDGDETYSDLLLVPSDVDRVIIELPHGEVLGQLEKARQKGIKHIWLHMGSHSGKAIEFAKENGMNLRYGTCAVMYVTPGLTYHSIHKAIMKIIGKF